MAAQIKTSAGAVARIAFIASDVVVSVQPSLDVGSEFTGELRALAAANVASVVGKAAPEVVPARQTADPLLSVFEPLRSGKLVSVTTTSAILLHSIPHLYKLAQYPVVLHVSLHPAGHPDYSVITSIRQSGFTFLQSETLQETQDIALTAHALALKSGKGVVHFFDSAVADRFPPIAVESAELVQQIIDQDAARRFRVSQPTPPTQYADSGRRATLAVPASQEPQASTSAPAAPQAEQPAVPAPSVESSVGSSVRGSSVDSAPSASSATTVDALVARPVTSADILAFATQIWETLRATTGRHYSAFEYAGPKTATSALFLFGADSAMFRAELESAVELEQYAGVGLIIARLYRPWIGAELSAALPTTVTRLAVLEQIRRKTTKWGPLLLDVLASVRGGVGSGPTVVGYQLGLVQQETVKQALRGIFQNLASESPLQNLAIGSSGSESQLAHDIVPDVEQPKLENAYTKVLNQLFGERLRIANQLGKSTAGVSSGIAASPEFGFGSLLARAERRKKFVAEVAAAAKSSDFVTAVPAQWLAKWTLVAEDVDKANALAPEVIARLSTDGSALASKLLASKDLFYAESKWLIGSDAWAYDLGNSGVHQVLASGEKVRMLIIDSTPYSETKPIDPARRKKDIGLYAMNFGNAYVASTAVYSSYTQLLHALIEADKFDGPAVVLAYLPYHAEADSALAVLQETKKAVDAGYWPLYRWNPSVDETKEERFALESSRIRKELEDFLRRDNYLTQVVRRHPEFATNLSGSYGTEVREQQKRKGKDAYAKLLEGLAGAPLTILFASDNGNGENLAKRLANRGKARGLKTMFMAMDDYPLEDLNAEENVVFITSTAGQGEFPQNGRNTWEAVRNSTDLDLATVNFAVFGLGDSHYWPRKQDRIYYNKPAKDLHNRLVTLGGKPLTEVGLGDDQDPDTYQTGYSEWEPQLWRALGVDNVEGLADEPPPITNEDIKIESNYLRGTIVEGLLDPTTAAISAADQQLTKFHGTYMQDDRDVRDQRKAAGLEPAYSFMIRCRLPGGVATPKQWVQMDDIAKTLGNGTMKLTTRQTFQFHGVVKGKLRPAMQAINRALMTTIAACGDVNRNVMCSSLPENAGLHRQVQAVAQRISDHLLPSTSAYHEIWLSDDKDFGKKTQVAGDAVVDHEPLYGPTYLPRKFKITIAVPPHNDTDVYAHDIGLIAIKDAEGNLEGFNVLAGGGMGVTHNNKKTYPQIGRMLGYVPAAETHIACEKIMLVQRDHGDRKNRKHARLKYTIDDMGVDVFRGKVEELWGTKFAPERDFKFESNIDTFGWVRDEDGLNHFTMFIENGRVEDTPDFQMMAGLRELAQVHDGEFRLTGNQHLIVSNVSDAKLPAIKEVLAKYKLDNTAFSGLRLSSSACVAFPTCGLAMAESERYLPVLISKLEGALEDAGLRRDSIVMRMTGCPNGCARPWLAEAAFVGKAFGAYNMYLGGGYHGQRLNKLYRASIKEEEIVEIMTGLIGRYAREREEGERFGDFLIRAGVIQKTTEGRDFHEGTAEDDDEE
ncbi:thiamine diphosphate-binding protein [Trichodelitschia bisporula]|uniref:Sulfite reductase [NADPH] subunit beta n=1 Tax=Trichodelitschia bisporula TaxID=703511 RepID=A0A6G1HLA2_9PEZI|nr:thiamine diphosphate-binding protein [Trichodelitschia bisporula]